MILGTPAREETTAKSYSCQKQPEKASGGFFQRGQLIHGYLIVRMSLSSRMGKRTVKPTWGLFWGRKARQKKEGKPFMHLLATFLKGNIVTRKCMLTIFNVSHAYMQESHTARHVCLTITASKGLPFGEGPALIPPL